MTEVPQSIDWERVAYLVNLSRALDTLEETRLLPQKKVLYQFSARGHELGQIILGLQLTHPHDAVGAYYRSRPLLLALGLDPEDALAAPMAKSGGYSDGRDIGVVCNLPSKGAATVLPMAGDVGSQFTPSAGWAQAILYRRDILGERSYQGAIAVVHAGEAAVATNGFWSALTIATTLKLPMLFYIEDNAFGISVPSYLQTPGGNIAENLTSFKGLKVMDADGTDPLECGSAVTTAVKSVRAGEPVLLRLSVPRLSGHSGQDTQAYKSAELIKTEQSRDPYPRLKSFVTSLKPAPDWNALESRANTTVEQALERAVARHEPEPARVERYIFSENSTNNAPEVQLCGGLAPEGHKFPFSSETPSPEATRINMLTAIRRTLQAELATNPKLLVFGEDVGAKGGVHAATIGLQEEFGAQRVFDTSLSEEGIIGRSVGMALAGLMPVAEIQFRKYADPATEQLNNCGTIRWRTVNRFAAPIVVRIPGGFAKCGDPWHSVSDEVRWTHVPGWQVAYPANAEDATGLLRSALRSNNPTIFFEHRALLDGASARRPYPGDHYVLPFGKAGKLLEGSEITVITWGAMVERCEEAAKLSGHSVELLDLRTLMPWDRKSVLDSVKKTRRCLIVHEDLLCAGFGAELSATIAEQGFFNLDAPIERLAVPGIPIPYNIGLMDAVLPRVDQITKKIIDLVER